MPKRKYKTKDGIRRKACKNVEERYSSEENLNGGVCPYPDLELEEEFFVRYLLKGAMDTLQHTHIELWKLYLQRQMLRGNAPYEIGFLVRTSEERYRKMVDLYNSSVTAQNFLRTREQILHLQTIEKLHWDVMHLANMLHEVERKYKIKPQVLEGRVFYPYGVKPDPNATTTTRKRRTTTRTIKTTTTIEDDDNDSEPKWPQ